MKQRIVGSSVGPGLRFFGISLSQSSLDQTRDLPDIAVGSKGAVLLLRSIFFYKELKYMQIQCFNHNHSFVLYLALSGPDPSCSWKPK